MPPRVAIPMPHSTDLEYAGRAIPQYERALTLAGAEPVRIPLDRTPGEVAKMVIACDGVLLPGSKADVDPSRFKADRSSHTASADPRRDTVDDLLLADAYRNGKPILGICYGLQSLNVFRGGSLIQHIPDFLPLATRGKVNHEAGKNVPIAHSVEIERNSRLAESIGQTNGHDSCNAAKNEEASGAGSSEIVIPVNSSHHQSADSIGSGLRIVARCTADGIIEAIEGTAPDHFVVAVQWHPERSVHDDEASIAIFRALVKAAGVKHP